MLSHAASAAGNVDRGGSVSDALAAGIEGVERERTVGNYCASSYVRLALM